MADADVTALFTEEVVAHRVDELAAAIATALPPRFTLVGLLKGSFVFVADLARALSKAGCSLRIEFMRVSSYGSGTTSSGIVSLMGDAPDGVRGEPVLLVDDIQDTGRTLAFTREFLLERGACPGLDLHPARQAVAPRGRGRRGRLHRLRDPGRVRGRLRDRLRRGLPRAALHRSGRELRRTLCPAFEPWAFQGPGPRRISKLTRCGSRIAPPIGD